MAPEQAIGDRMVDHRVDIWSLGVMFYECLSGARPVEGENAAHMVMRLLSTGIIPIRQLVPTLPHDLAELIGRMLSREPAQRPQDLREVCAALAPLANVWVPAFGEPHVQQVSRDIGPATFAQVSAPPVSWGARTPLAGEGDRAQIGERARPDVARARTFRAPRALMVAGTAAAGIALAAAQWFHAARPAPAVTSAVPFAAADDPVATLVPPAPLKAAAQGQPAEPPSHAQPSADVTAGVPRRTGPLEPSRAAPSVKPPGARGAPTPAAAASSSEPTKPAPSPSNALDIQLQ